MKRRCEKWMDIALSAGQNSRSRILRFSAPIGPNETAVPFSDCVQAIMPEHTPAEKDPIEIKIKGMHYKDSDTLYWKIQPEVLRAAFEQKVAGRFENGEIVHMSVFALAPIPLLIECLPSGPMGPTRVI